MALHSKKEFAELCGIPTNALSVYIKRNKVVLSGDFIDDQFPPNAEFLRNRLEKLGKSSETVPVKPEPKLTYSEPKQLEISAPNIQEPKINTFELTEALRRQELLKKEAETRLLNLKEEKIRGEVVPVDLVKQFFIIDKQSTMTSMKDGIEYLLIEISKHSRYTGEQLAELRGKMVYILNEGLRKSSELTNRNMKAVVSEFSLKREVGEHD